MSAKHWSRAATLQADTSGEQSAKRIADGILDTDLLSYVTFFFWICGLSFVVFPSARVNWCSCASVVIFSNSVVVISLSSLSVPFSVINMLRSARCMSLLSVGVVE